MHGAPSARHVRAAQARWGRTPKREAVEGHDDIRQPIPLPLAHVGWRNVTLEPRRGYVSWRCRDDETGEVLRCAALKELLRWVARQVPRMLSIRACD